MDSVSRPNSPPNRPPTRLEGIDALRGLASSAIVIHHVVALNQIALPAALSFIPAYFGYGVPLFFIISAFSLFYTYSSRMETRLDVQAYIVRRFARIAPLFYVMTAVWVATYKWKFGQVQSVGNILSNLTFTFNFVPAYQNGICWAAWSIGTEFAFYFFLPLLLVSIRRQRGAIAMLVLTFLAAYGYQTSQNPIDDTVFILTYLPFFAMGIAGYFVFESLSKFSDASRKWLSIVFLLSSTILIGLTITDGPFHNMLSRSVRRTDFYVLGFGLALIVFSQGVYPFSILSNKVTRFLGEISFSLYLLHPWLILILKPVYVHLAGSPRHLVSHFALATGITFIVLLPLAYLSYRFVELPGIAWGKRASARIRNEALAGKSVAKPIISSFLGALY
ncbi:MAG TPA: acyltransferase [Bryobacteraceae bacterium]|nr:acyltransferase [Bryobacteraceae bacterium]